MVRKHDGRGTFSSDPREQLGTKGDPSSVFTADLDRDGDVDVLSAERAIRRCFHLSGVCQIVIEGSGIVWYENVDGSGRLGTAQVINDSESTFARAEDFDGDGDMDVVAFVMSSMPYFPLGRIAWYENIDGKGAFGPEQIIASEASNVSSIAVADVDSDGDQDLLSSWSSDGRIDWHENRVLGDSNDDGVFDSSDLVAVFAAGEYEDDISNNSTFDEGDWNGDGDFDTADLVAVFRVGTFSREVRAVELTAAVEAIFEFEGMKNKPGRVAVHGERNSGKVEARSVSE